MHSIWLKEPSIKSYKYFLKLQNYNVVIPHANSGTILQLVLHVLCLVLCVICRAPSPPFFTRISSKVASSVLSPPFL